MEISVILLVLYSSIIRLKPASDYKTVEVLISVLSSEHSVFWCPQQFMAAACLLVYFVYEKLPLLYIGRVSLI